VHKSHEVAEVRPAGVRCRKYVELNPEALEA
jgi:hypothetical protein